MKRITKFGSILAILGLTACSTASLEELRQAEPSNDPFRQMLAQKYLAFAESEVAQYDWWSAKHFADKGLETIYGRTITPEIPAEWGIKPEIATDMNHAREQLLGLIGSPAWQQDPILSAKAFYYYDCWVEQQGEGWQEDDIASCREGFYRSVKTLLGAPQATDDKPLIFSTSYIIFFDFDKSLLTAEANRVLDSAASDLKESGETDYEVVLNGHADKAGNAEYNLRLSQKRAEAAKQGLIKRGIPEKLIRYYAFGDTDSRIPTPPNKPEQANRRVEIFFNQ